MPMNKMRKVQHHPDASLLTYKQELSAMHTQKPTAPLSSFHKFPDLFTELRFLIWEFAIPDPRIVTLDLRRLTFCEHAMYRVRSDIIVPDRCRYDYYPGYKGTLCQVPDTLTWEDELDLSQVELPYAFDGLYAPSTGAPPPGMLFACKESRQIALRSYQPAFPGLGAITGNYLDFERDTLLLKNVVFTGVMPVGWLLRLNRDHTFRVRNLSFQVDHRRRSSQNPLHCIVARILHVFPNLKKLTVLVQHYQNQQLEGDMTSKDREKEWTFFEPIDIKQALHMFTQPNMSRLGNGVLQELKHEFHVNEARIGMLFRPVPTEPPVRITDIPPIEYKILTTMTVKRKFEELKQKYERSTGYVCHRVKETDQFSIDPRLLQARQRHIFRPELARY